MSQMTEKLEHTYQDPPKLGNGNYSISTGIETDELGRQYVRYIIVDTTNVPVDPMHPEYRQICNYRLHVKDVADHYGSVAPGAVHRLPVEGYFDNLRIDGDQEWYAECS